MSTFGASSETEFLNHYCNMLRNIPRGTKFLRFGDFFVFCDFQKVPSTHIDNVFVFIK